jgi:predicted RNA-binding protein
MVKHQMKWRFIVDNTKENEGSVVKMDINCSNIKIKEVKMAAITVEI